MPAHGRNAAALADWYVPDCSPSLRPNIPTETRHACILASLVSLVTLTGTFFATASAADAPDKEHTPQTLCLATAEPARKKLGPAKLLAHNHAQAVLIAALISTSARPRRATDTP